MKQRRSPPVMSSTRRSAGVRFLFTSAIVCLWSVGIALVDLVLMAVGQYVFAAALGAGGLAGAGAVGHRLDVTAVGRSR